MSIPLAIDSNNGCSEKNAFLTDGPHVKAELEERKLKAIDDEIARRRREYGIKYFVPNRPQLKATQSGARIVCYTGGNRGGKSTAGAEFLSGHLSRTYPGCECHGEWFNEEKRFPVGRSLKALVVATSFQKIEEVIEPKLMSLLPKTLIQRVVRGQMGYLRRVELKDGSKITCLSGDQDDMEFESADWDIAWIDEPMSHAKFIAIMRGLLDRRGLMILTFTPTIEPWMKDEFLDKADGKFIDVVEADTYENTEDIHGSPILTKQSIEEFEKTMSEDEKETRIHGKFFHLRGIVYKNFGDVHYADEFSYEEDCKKQGKLPVICVLDPHDRRPHHVIWAYLDTEGDIHVDYELVTHCELDELARRIRQVEKERGYKMRRRLIDPNFGLRPSKPGSNRTVKDEIAFHGVGFYPANDEIELGHMIVRDYLNWDSQKPLSATNKPKLFFSKERASYTIKSMRNYQYADWKGTTKDERDPKEQQKDKDTHGADCIRYLCISKPQYTRMTEEAEYELESMVY